VVALDPIICILNRVVQQVIDNAEQRCSQIGGYICRTFAARQHHLEELGGRCDVASLRDEHINDLAVLVHRSVRVPPHTGHLDVGLIHEPPVGDAVAPWSRGVDDQRREPLHPPIDRHMINVHSTLGEQLCNVAIDTTVCSGGTSARPTRSRPAGTGSR